MIRADNGLAFLLRYENVAWYDQGKVRILDRRIYPSCIAYVTCTKHQEVAGAIADMVTQSGGPYTAAAMGMALAAYECRGKKQGEQTAYLERAAYLLSHARPTTVAQMETAVGNALDAAKVAMAEGKDVVEAVFQRALLDLNTKYLRILQAAKYLVQTFPKNGTVMTMCFAETMVGMMLRVCREQGNAIKVICPETRPYFQGARLTASCVKDMGFDVTVITDNMPAWTMKQKQVDVFTSAADVITMDGHIINKVGTFQIALAARYWDIPYYVSGTPDKAHATTASVVIEERDPELVMIAMGTKTTKDGVKGYYPAFDITPPSLCSGVVTEKGIFPANKLRQYYA